MLSGRESLPLSERIGLLRADLMKPPFFGVGPDTPATSDTVHDLKLTIGAIRSVIEMYEQAIARGETDERLSRGADRIVAPIECQVLAWRRGGHREYQKVRREQRGV